MLRSRILLEMLSEIYSAIQFAEAPIYSKIFESTGDRNLLCSWLLHSCFFIDESTSGGK